VEGTDPQAAEPSDRGDDFETGFVAVLVVPGLVDGPEAPDEPDEDSDEPDEPDEEESADELPESLAGAGLFAEPLPRLARLPEPDRLRESLRESLL
jgi:hypothetical protein